MRRNDDIEIFSMSFLDLISCAMAGVLVLYTIADRESSATNTPKVDASRITLTFDDDAVGNLGYYVRFDGSFGALEGSSCRRGGKWKFDSDEHSGLMATLLLDKQTEAGNRLTLRIEDFDFTKKYPGSIPVRVGLFDRRHGFKRFTMILNAENEYKSELSL